MVRDLSGVVEDVSRIAAEVTAREADLIDREYVWPERTMQALQAERIAGLVVPVEHGGLGHGLAALAQVCELLGRESASAGLCFGMHSVGTAVIASKATADQADRYLRPIAEGSHLTTLALSEPGTGSEFWYPETRIDHDTDSGYRVTGTKSFVTNGGHADSYVVSGFGGDGQVETGHFSCVMVADGADGVEWQEPWRGLGMRGNSSRTVKLNEVRVAEGDLLGEEGDQIWYVFNVVAPYFLVAMAGTYVGVASRALDVAVEHLRERSHSHSGRALSQVDVLQHRLGRAWAGFQRTRQLVLWAANEADRQGAQTLPALCSAKAEVAGCAVQTVNECMTLTGGIAYREGSLLERLLRDARAADVMSPTTDILYTWAGRAVLDEPLLGE